MTAEKIIDSLRFTATEADEQKDLFTPSHVLYKCRIVNPANNRRYTFDYQCNPSATHEPTKEDCLYCILSDASCVESCTDEADFLTEFGYIDGGADQVRKGLKAYKACKRTAAAIDRIFTEDEKTALKLFKRAAKLGNAAAQYNLGMAYACGYYGVTPDKDKALHWLKQSVKGENPVGVSSSGTLLLLHRQNQSGL